MVLVLYKDTFIHVVYVSLTTVIDTVLEICAVCVLMARAQSTGSSAMSHMFTHVYPQACTMSGMFTC